MIDGLLVYAIVAALFALIGWLLKHLNRRA